MLRRMKKSSAIPENNLLQNGTISTGINTKPENDEAIQQFLTYFPADHFNPSSENQLGQITRFNSQSGDHYQTQNQVTNNGEGDTEVSHRWFDPLEDFLPVSFCRDTSLHGLKYIGQEKRHFTERLFWAFAFIASVVAAALLINELWISYKTKPIIVSFQETETKLFDVPFPAITICNVNNIQKSKADVFITEANVTQLGPNTNEALAKMNYLNFVCKTSASFSQKLNFSNENWPLKNLIEPPDVSLTGQEYNSSVAEFLQEYAQNCSAMLLKCIWENKEVSCNDFFDPIQTDFGKCCQFNMVPEAVLHRFNKKTTNKQLEEAWESAELSMDDLLLTDKTDPKIRNSKYPRRIKRPGKTYGLSILLDPDLEDYLCTTADSTGFQMVTHVPTEIPRVADYGLAIRPNTETFIRVMPDITTADPEIFDIELEKRNCYFNGEYKLAYYKYYTTVNCIDECFTNWTYRMCECVRFFMLRDDDMRLCNLTEMSCIDNAKVAFVNHTTIKGACSQCRPTCTEINYITETTVSIINTDIRNWLDPVTGLGKQWENSNVSIVHIYFGQDSTYSKVRKRMYGTTDLIAYMGGVLGLCMGFSGLSLLEIVYFLTIRAFCKFRNRNLRRRDNPTAQVVVADQLQNANENAGIWSRLSIGNGNANNPAKLNSKGIINSTKIQVHNKNSAHPHYSFGELKPNYNFVN